MMPPASQGVEALKSDFPVKLPADGNQDAPKIELLAYRENVGNSVMHLYYSEGYANENSWYNRTNWKFVIVLQRTDCW
jgi:hypothetical protein